MSQVQPDNSLTGITAAAGGTLVTATAINPLQFFSQYSTVADSATTGSADSGCVLPKSPYMYPMKYTLSNSGAGTLIVWPANSTGASTDTIDGSTTAGTAGTYVAVVLPGQTKEFAAFKNAAGVITWLTVGVRDNGKAPIKKVTVVALGLVGPLTVQPCESGCIWAITNGSAADFAVTLPAIAGTLGVKYKFIYNSAANQTNNVSIDATSACIQGGVVTTSAGALISGTAARTHITFTHAATGTKIGDYVELSSDGVSWFLNGLSASATAGIVLS